MFITLATLSVVILVTTTRKDTHFLDLDKERIILKKLRFCLRSGSRVETCLDFWGSWLRVWEFGAKP